LRLRCAVCGVRWLVDGFVVVVVVVMVAEGGQEGGGAVLGVDGLYLGGGE
jgi:hypothetical protein